MRPDRSNITFVMQGPIVPHVTLDSLASIRRTFPASPIILSTWTGYDISNLIYDELICSDDPGGFYYSDREDNWQNNVNRQIVSTLAGLQRVQTEYAFKIRTDFKITGDDFLKYWNRYPAVVPDYKVFGDKLLACSYFSRNPSSRMNFPYHPSDLAFFGKTADVMHLFNVPLMTETEAYLDTKNRRFNRYAAEQYLFINCLRKCGKSVLLECYNDISRSNIIETEKYFASNFVFLTFEQFNLEPKKIHFFMHIDPEGFGSCYTHNEWIHLHQKHADSSVKVPSRDKERERIEFFLRMNKEKGKLKKHINNFITPIKGFVRWGLEPISILFYAIKIAYKALTNFREPLR